MRLCGWSLTFHIREQELVVPKWKWWEIEPLVSCRFCQISFEILRVVLGISHTVTWLGIHCEFDISHLNVTGDPLHSRALAHSRAPLFTQPCTHCSHSRAPREQWARLCVFTLQGCVQAARLCRGSPVNVPRHSSRRVSASRREMSRHWYIYWRNAQTGVCFNTSGPRQNGRHFADDIFRWIFMNEKFCILIKISLKFVLKGAINNNPALV